MRLPIGPAGDVVANSEKDGLNCFYSAFAGDADQFLLGHLLLAAGKVARQPGVGDAFRLVVNNGAEAGQTVFHLHLHILAGRPLHWSPG